MIVLGIDPGYKTGWALCELRAGGPPLFRVEPAGQPECGTWLNPWGDAEANKYTPADLVCVQVPAGEKAARVWNRASTMSLVRNGMLSGWIAGLFRGAGRDVFLCPAPDCKAWGMKMPEAQWRALWGGYKGRVSEHARDAAQLALHGARRWMEMRRAGNGAQRWHFDGDGLSLNEKEGKA